MRRAWVAFLAIPALACEGSTTSGEDARPRPDAAEVDAGSGLAAPTDLRADLRTEAIDLRWHAEPRPKVAAFRVERSNAADQGFAAIGTPPIPFFRDGSASAEAVYYFRVFAVGPRGEESPPSEVLEVSTRLEAPLPPSDLTASEPTAGSVLLRWTDNSNDEQGFRIERDLGNNGFVRLGGALAAETTEATDAAVEPATDYRYRIIAFNAGGDSAPSNIAAITTRPAAPLAPPAPGGVTAVGNSNVTALISWNDVAGEDGYAIQRRQGAATFAEIVRLGAGVTRFLDLRLTPQATYDYRVVAFNAVGSSMPSSPASATTLVTAVASHRLVVTVAGGGSGTITGTGISCGSDCSEVLPAGTSVTLTAAAAGGSSFLRFIGCDRATRLSCTVTMDAARVVRVELIPSFNTNISGSLTGVEATQLDTNGSYAFSWTCSGLCASSWTIQEAAGPELANPTSYFSTSAPCTFSGSAGSCTFTGKPAGTYCYRATAAGLGTGQIACLWVQPPGAPAAEVEIINNLQPRDDVSQLRLGSSAAEVIGDPTTERLSPDLPCRMAIGDAISAPGGRLAVSTSQLGPTFGLYLGIGQWDSPAYPCGAQWAKNPHQVDATLSPSWRWIAIRIGDHYFGRRSLRLEYGAGSALTLVLDTGEALPLNVTGFDPITGH
ncbi:MAG: hypothetical protein IT384_09815 [Deltaproteobacteria bacterium]|nr:hypothetical protein [Deltaproteobacteria bacterium]